jgi:hypothetical protein
MLAAFVTVHYHETAFPTWLSVLLCLPTAAAVIALIVVLIRERRKRHRP